MNTFFTDLTVQKKTKLYLPSLRPSACNPVCKYKQKLFCDFCIDEKGKSKIFHSIWSLRQHCFAEDHCHYDSMIDELINKTFWGFFR